MWEKILEAIELREMRVIVLHQHPVNLVKEGEEEGEEEGGREGDRKGEREREREGGREGGLVERERGRSVAYTQGIHVRKSTRVIELH